MNIAFIDIDGVIANADKRFALAEQAKQQALALNATDKQATDAYWRTAFNPEHIALDELIEGAGEAIRILEDDYDILYLTSRPEYLREATRTWLKRFDLIRDLIMKPASFQYHLKTVTWKVGTIHQMAAYFSAKNVLVIDDEQANLDEMAKLPFSIKTYTSLKSIG